MQNKLLIILSFTLNFLSCTLFQRTEQTENLLPNETEIPGWQIISSPRIFSNNSINKYIKEKKITDLLITYGFRELSVAKYKSLSKSAEEITVEIYKMDTPLNAFGILSMERSEEYQKENQGEDSYSNQRELFLRKGNYYIKIKSNTEFKASIENLRAFSNIICSGIRRSNNTLPGYLSLFNKKGERLSLKYRIEGLPELADIKNIFIVKIEISGKTKTIIFAKRNSTYSSFGEFSNLLKDKEKHFILSSASEVRTAFSGINNNIYIFISVYKEWIFGITDADSMSEGEKAVYYLYNDLIQFLKSV